MTGVTVIYERSLMAASGPDAIVVTTTVSPSVRYAELLMLGRRTTFEVSVYEEGDLWQNPDPVSTLARASVGQERFSFRLPGLDGVTDGLVLVLRHANVVWEIVMFGPREQVDLDRATSIAHAALDRLEEVARTPLSAEAAARPDPTPESHPELLRSR